MEKEIANSSKKPSKNNTKIKKILIIGVTIVAIVLLAAFVGYFFWLNKPLATINGKTITKEEMSKKLPSYKKLFKSTNQTDLLNDLEASALKAEIEKVIIETESAKRGIVISQATFDEEYKKLVALYKNEQEFVSANNSAYGYSDAEAKRSIKIKLLKSKLIEVVIKHYDAELFMVRFDQLPAEATPTENDNLKKESSKKISEAYALSKQGISLGDIRDKYQLDPDWAHPNVSAAFLEEINSVNSINQFNDPSLFKAIVKIDKIGDYTPILESSKGFYTFFIIKNIQDSKFEQWIDYLNSFPDYRNAEKSVSYLQEISTLVLGNNAVLAKCTKASSSDEGNIDGWVKTTLGDPINGVALSYQYLNSNGWCPGI
ncbi:MAG: SurA N-terminal domain-containing protein [bacterium]